MSYVHGRSSEKKLIPQSNQSGFTKAPSIIFSVRQINMTGGGPTPAARHVDLSYGANIRKASFVNPLCFEGEKVYFRTRSRMQRPRAWPKSCKNPSQIYPKSSRIKGRKSQIIYFHEDGAASYGTVPRRGRAAGIT